MASKYYLGIMDYLIIVLTLFISTAIGFRFKSTSKDTGKIQDYFMAGKNMALLPVIMSATATMISPLATIGIPAEIYKYGIQMWTLAIGASCGMLLSTYVFIPVYFQCGVCTVYEYLEKRFGKPTRYFISAMFILQMVLWMSPILYSPVLAMNAVTDLPLEPSILVFGVICTIYCTLGGLKAVLWTDVFQTILMFVTALMLLTGGVQDAGGIANVLDRAKEGKRLELFNFDFDFTTRYTSWNGFFQGLFYGVAAYGVNQTGVQRLLSLSKIERAKSALLITTPLVFILHIFGFLHGVVLYSVYFKCDPILNNKDTGLTKYDQIVPYYLVSKFHSFPGLTGLSVAGIFCASLTTISSILNSLTTTTVVDFVHPIFQSLQTNEKKSLLIAKVLSFAYGSMCISIALFLTKVRSISQVGFLFNNTFEGPILAIFTIGVLTRKGYGKSVFIGLLAGLAITQWIGFSSLFSGYIEPPLPLHASMCTSIYNSTYDYSTTEISKVMSPDATSVPSSDSEIFILNKMPYFWIRPIGFFVTFCCTYIAILISGWKTTVIPSDSEYLSPVAGLWMKKAKTSEHQKGNITSFALDTLPSLER